MAFIPEPWQEKEFPDVEIAEEMSSMEALNPPYEPAGPKHDSLFRRYWERLVRNYNR
ncbi:MAG TPA: hypothetical protein GX699_10925 [Firmicutes bacterium]|nr:hypothetical protein [Bacillota bacterium]